jgi:hypothetical protein
VISRGLVDSAFAVAVVRGARRHGLLTRTATATEIFRLGVGAAYAVATYFGRARAPDHRVLRAGRTAAPVRAAGVVLAVAGRGRRGETLLIMAWGVGARFARGVVQARAHRRPDRSHGAKR